MERATFVDRSLLLAGAFVVLGVAISAQSHPGKVFLRTNKPLRNVTLDLTTGTVSHQPAVKNKAAITTTDFANNDLGGFAAVDTGNSFCEWFDAGTKGFAGNRSDLMDDIVFAYCSSALMVSSGGPGGSVKLGFYEGYLVGGGAPTTAVAVLTLTGLPANSSSSSYFGGFRCYFIHVLFGSLVAFADGPIGYSWKFLDLAASGPRAATWPFLSCVGSCSGTGTIPDKQGMVDAIDEYCPPGTLRTTFTYATNLFPRGGPGFTSMAMSIREAIDLASTSTHYNATVSPNGDTLNANHAVIGTIWSAALTRRPATAPGSFTLKLRTNRVGAANGFPAPPPVQGRVLISGAPLATLVGVHNGTSGSVNSAIPLQLGMLALHYACQAVTTGGGVTLSSAVEGTTGTF